MTDYIKNTWVMKDKRNENMKVSTEIASAANIIGEEKAVEYIARAGFDAWDFSMMKMTDYSWETKKCSKTSHPLAGSGYLSFARRLKRIGLDNGIVCNQSHAPVPTYSDEVRSYFKRAIECTAEAGGKICVIHPDHYRSPKENAQMYLELLPFAKEYGVKIATENMWDWDYEKDVVLPTACSDEISFKAHIDAVGDKDFGACVDIGHAEMRGLNTSAPKMIRALGKSVIALHIHDNDLLHDSHQIPFSMDIDFKEVVSALKDIGYRGYLTLEACEYLKKYDKDGVLKGLGELYEAVKRMADMF